MRKLRLLPAFLALFTAICFISCDSEPVDPVLMDNENPIDDNDDDDDDDDVVASGIFKADFNGQTWSTTTAQAIVNGDYISITAIKPDGTFFMVTVPQSEEGTYVWPETEPETPSVENLIAVLYSQGSGQVPYLSESDDYGDFADLPSYTDTAEIVITEIDEVNEIIKGTFKFTGIRYVNPTEGFETETLVVTNGSFDLSYSADVVAPTGNSFFAKLDGADFVPTNIQGYEMMNVLSVVGRRGNIENIGISVPSDITPGTYELGSFFSDYKGIYILNDTPQGTFGADSGSVTITTHDTVNKRIKGTFFFAATMVGSTSSFDITQGAFDVGY